MDNAKNIKKSVKEKYGQIAKGKLDVIPQINSCCSPKSSCCGAGDSAIDMSQRYETDDLSAVPDGADLGLGCGTPAAYAGMEAGMTVLDLGSGAGIDCFIAARHVGSSGKVIGVDMTEEMVRKANENKAKIGASNVEFRFGEIEALPVESGSVDRVISNCVINLVPDKNGAFKEIFRVMKKEGKFTISDIVVDGAISEKERMDAALWAGCISGAIGREEYIGLVEKAGFRDVRILSEKKYDYRLESGGSLHSITLSGTK